MLREPTSEIYEYPETAAELSAKLDLVMFKHSLGIGNKRLALQKLSDDDLARIIQLLPPYLVLACYAKAYGKDATAWLADQLDLTFNTVNADVRSLHDVINLLDRPGAKPEEISIKLGILIARGMRKGRHANPNGRYTMSSRVALYFLELMQEEVLNFES